MEPYTTASPGHIGNIQGHTLATSELLSITPSKVFLDPRVTVEDRPRSEADKNSVIRLLLASYIFRCRT